MILNPLHSARSFHSPSFRKAMLDNVDFSEPLWLIWYFHVIGIISLNFDVFSVYLILFKSSQVDSFRFFLQNFQIACMFTDIHITFLMQPVPLYPLMGGYAMGFLATRFGVTLHFCITIVVFLYIYQVASMIVCFVKKNQSISGTLTSFSIPRFLIWFLLIFLLVYTVTVVGMYYSLSVEESKKMKFVKENLPEYQSQFQALPNFSIYQANSMLFIMVIVAVTGGLLAFLFFMAVLYNIFRMLSFMKIQMSANTYKRHRAAVYSLIAQFATSSVCFLPPISLVFVVFFKLPYAQVLVELLLAIACTHSPLNVSVLVATFPPYRAFFCRVFLRKETAGLPALSAKTSTVVISHLST
ncbi:hypothetical protein L3Y34_019150 [Caenorhabditis briggsae]|uniref:Serpentine Receptor, class I n=1 Tax=Caenorhabditis briggsae TaxID=6238 RepID=A0AAE9DMK1_CAEBR|nr:hypothetical protein L3Y34_019150 [Caenorhabditis briggsae]